MKTITNYRLTSIAIAIITLIAIPTAIAGKDSVISGAIIQVGWCGPDNYVCLVSTYFIVSIAVIILCFLLDLIINRRQSRAEKIFKLTAHPPLPKDPNEPRWASVTVENISPLIMEKCFLTLDDVLDKKGKSILEIHRQRRLLWSWGEGKENRDKELDITPKEPRVADVALTLIDTNQVMFETWTGREIKPKGVYEVIVSVHGRLNDRPKVKTTNFVLEYAGDNILTIIEKGKDEWTDSNPRKPKKKKNKLPPVSTNSSS